MILPFFVNDNWKVKIKNTDEKVQGITIASLGPRNDHKCNSPDQSMIKIIIIYSDRV